MALKLMFAVMFTANLASIVTSQANSCYDEVANTNVKDKQVILRDARTICYCEKNRGYELGCRILTPNIEAVINAINIPCEGCPKKMDITAATEIVQRYIDRLEQMEDSKDMANHKIKIGRKIGQLQCYKKHLKHQLRRHNKELALQQQEQEAEELVPKPQDPAGKGYKKYEDTWLKTGTDSLQFFSAKEVCEQDGGHLVYVKNDSDLNRIIGLIDDSKSDNFLYWVGAEDLLTEGSFKWFEGSSVQTSLFDSGEPNNGDGCVKPKGKISVNYKNHTDVDVTDGEDCLALYYHLAGLIDACCTEDLSYICQHDG